MSTENQGLAQAHRATTQIESSRAVQEVQASMVLAKRFPRDERQALDRILNACTRPGLANAAVYQYARGGSDISGPSIRLAETIAQNWGNIQFGIRELEQIDGESVVEAFAWDIETNTRQTKTFTVRHERHTKQGARRLTDPRDIYELVANNGARRLRACILGIIPGDVIEAAVSQCETTMSSDADTSPEAQKKIVDSFAKFRVTKEQIEARIQRRLDSITPAQVVALRKIMASLRDGMSKPEEWFPAASAPAVVPPLFSGAAAVPAVEARSDSAANGAAAPRDVFWGKVEESGMDHPRVIGILRRNKLAEIEKPSDLSDEDASAALLVWETLVELYGKEVA